MIQHVVQKKRVIVMDCDITIGEDDWKKIMRHVLGRHFADLRGKGPGWSFSHTHLETFSSMVDKHLSSDEAKSSCSDDKSTETSTDGKEEEQQSSDEQETTISQTSCSSTDDETAQTVEEQDPSSDDRSFQSSDTQTAENVVLPCCVEQKEIKSVQNNETQTCSPILFETKKLEKHVYKFDVDDQVRFFVDHWKQKANFLV